MQYILHRHRLRVRQSHHNAVVHCQRERLPLYLLKAADEVRDGDRTSFTDEMKVELLGKTNPRFLHHLPSFLPLYIGMRLLLYSKDCVRFGLMNGCECVLEHIVFAEEEDLPAPVVAGQPVHACLTDFTGSGCAVAPCRERVPHVA